MSTHTPGPWIIVGRIIDADNGRVTADGRKDVWERVAIVDTGPTPDESEANARLIAAAPDLLAACIAALPALSAHADTGCDCPDTEAAKMLRAGIAKAKGD